MTGTSQAPANIRGVNEELALSQAHLGLALEAGQMGTWEWDILAGRVRWSPQEERLYGLEPGSFDGTVESYRARIHPDDVEGAWRAVEVAMGNGSDTHHVLHRIVRPDGEVRWLDSHGRFLRDRDGRPVRLVGVSTDITGRMRYERLRERQDEMLGAVDVGFWYCDLPFDVLNWDAKVCEHFWIRGNRPVAIGEFYDRMHPDDRERTRAAIEHSIVSHAPYDIEYRTVAPPDHPLAGEEKWIRAIGYTAYDPQDRPIRFDGITVDITGTRRAAAALTQAEVALRQATEEDAQLIATLQRIGSSVAAELDIDRIVQLVTDEATRLTGAQFGAFFYNVVNEKGEAYTLYTISGVPREMFSKFPMPRNTDVFAPTFRGDGIVRSDDITKDPRYGHNAPHHGMPHGHLPVVSYLAASVKSHSGEVLGGLFFGHGAPGVFTERHERLLEGIAGWATLAMDNARLFAAQRTAAHEAERARAGLQDVFEQAPAAISVTEGPDHVTVSQNAISRGLIGGRSTIGQKLLDVLPDAKEQGFLDILDTVYRTGTPFHGREMTLRFDFDGDGVAEERQFNVVYQPLRDGEGLVHGILSHAVDVTELVVARREVERKADELSRLTSALERTNRELDQFAYVASHDLKAPLRGIANLTQWIEEDLGERVTGQSREHMQLLKGRVQRLEALIDGILTYSRAGRSRGAVEPIDTGALVRECIDMLGVGNDVRFRLPASFPTILAERTPLQQVFLNLINNAVKFTRAGRPDVVIDIGWADREDTVEFSIADNGPGIAPEFHDRIWGIFQTLQARDKIEGTGIGLAVVKKSIEMRGGRVWLESQPGTGAVFHFTVAKVATRDDDQPSTSPTSLSSFRPT